MNLKRLLSKKVVAIGLAAGIAIGGGGAAFAYFTSTGSGTGSAQTGSASALTISQVGAGYDSLIPTAPGNDPYIQDQCLSGCTGPSQFGNEIHLASTGYSQLADVTVAFRNWGAAAASAPLTFNIYAPGNTVTPIATDTQSFALPAAVLAGVTPTAFNLTFNFSSQGDFIPQDVIFGITYGDPSGTEASLNVALSSSSNDISVGTDAVAGSVWLQDTHGNNNDFPANCAIPTDGIFQAVNVDCGTQNPGNPGAYGTPAQVLAGNGDIPAVEIDVVGGTAAPLSPGGPAQPVSYAVTNPGSSSVLLGSVTTALHSVGSNGGSSEMCTIAMYQVNNATATVNQTLAPGATAFYLSTGTTVQMNNDGNNQDNCQGQPVVLDFASA